MAEQLDVGVTGNARKDVLLASLGGVRPVAVREVLPSLSRDRLKELCRKLAVDDSGRDKASLVERLMPARTQPPVQKRLPLSEPPRNPIDGSELESHLWEAANILRGSPVDRTDWKSYILPLLFFKRICDVWDEEHTAMLAEYGEDFADEHRFQVPDDAHWSVVRAATKNVGAALANAMRSVEAANQKHLYGVFGDAQWTNKDRLPDELLKDLIEHFSLLSRLGTAASRPTSWGTRTSTSSRSSPTRRTAPSRRRRFSLLF